MDDGKEFDIMAVISGGFNSDMNKMEEKLYKADFSKNTDLKERLASRLFSSAAKSTTSSFVQLNDEDLEFVNAAQGTWTDIKDDKKF